MFWLIWLADACNAVLTQIHWKKVTEIFLTVHTNTEYQHINSMRQDWKQFWATFLTWKREVGSIPQCVDQFNPVYWVFPIIDSDMQTEGEPKSRKNRKLILISFSQVRVRRIEVRQKSVKTTAVANLLFEAAFKGGWFQTRGENAVVCRCSLPIFTEFGRIWICTILTLEVLEILAILILEVLEILAILLWMRTRWLLDNCLIIASTGQLNSLSPSSSSSSSSLLVPVTSTHCHHHHQCHIDKHRNHQRRRYNYSLSRLDF